MDWEIRHLHIARGVSLCVANLLFFFGDQLPRFSSSLRTRELTLLRDDGCLQAGDLAEIKKTFG